MMPAVINVPSLATLHRALDERGVPGERMLEAVSMSGATSVYLAASGFTRRTDLLMPFDTDALHVINPNVSPIEIPDRAMLRVVANDDVLDAAMVVVGSVPAATAIDHAAPATGRDAWRPIVDAMLTQGGRLMSRTHYLTEPVGAITVRYDERGIADDDTFREMVDALAKRLGIPLDQRELWPELHAANGRGAAVTIASSCGPNGPKPELGFLYRTPQWDTAVDLAKLAAPAPYARGAAMAFGALAGILGVHELSGVEVVLGSAGPDVVIWAVVPTEAG